MLINPMQKLKYLFSSGVAFIIHYILLLYLNSKLPVASLEIGAFISWCISSLTNFFINRNFVFKSTSPLFKDLSEYYILAVIVFVLKTYVLVEFFTRVVRIPIEYAVPISEVVFYVFNYFIQKKFIFKNKENNEKLS